MEGKSYNDLKAEYLLLRGEYNSLYGEDRNNPSERGTKLLSRMGVLSEEMKSLYDLIRSKGIVHSEYTAPLDGSPNLFIP